MTGFSPRNANRTRAALIRITLLTNTPDEVVLKLEGRLAGEDVDVLAAEGKRWLAGHRRLVLEISGMQQIDRQGVRLLQQWTERGLILRGAAGFIRQFMSQHGFELEER